MNAEEIKARMQAIALTEEFKLAYNYLIAPRDRNLYPLRTVGETDAFLLRNCGEASKNAWREYKELESELEDMPVSKPIVKGSIVKARCGWYRVSAVIAGTVNLKSVFGSKIWFKRVPLAECVEDEAAWYANWQQSETYKSM
jgi:hypothetical protein